MVSAYIIQKKTLETHATPLGSQWLMQMILQQMLFAIEYAENIR